MIPDWLSDEDEDYEPQSNDERADDIDFGRPPAPRNPYEER